MKSFSILLLSLGLMLQTVQAQYQKAYNYARQLEQKQDYYKAIITYNAANAALDKPKENNIADRIAYCANKLNRLRTISDSLNSLAQAATEKAESQKQEIDSLYQLSKSALALAEEMQQKVETALLDKAIKDHFKDWKGFAKYSQADSTQYKILNRIDSLDLSDNALLRIPKEVSKCPNLKFINLLGNTVFDWKASDSILSKLNDNLEIYASVKDLSEIDSSYWHLVTGLEILPQNSISIPQNILKQKQLKYLNLDENELLYLPPEIGSLTNLRELSLYRNKLQKLPVEIGKLINLNQFTLQDNRLAALPPEIGLLKNLTELDLDNNLLITLPVEIGALTNLDTLTIDNNHLLTLPKEIGELKKLSLLYLKGNKLVKLPSEIGKLTNLNRLSLMGNSLIKIPSEIGSLINLTELSLFNNDLTTIPDALMKLVNLSYLNLGENMFTNLPREIGNLINLTSLGLRSNKLKTLPPEIGKLTKLSSLYIEGNEFQEKLKVLGKMSNLTELTLNVDQLKAIPEEIIKLKKLTSLYLYDKEFYSLPGEIKELTRLTKLYLIGDSIITLPAEISGLANLKELHLNITSMSHPPPEIGNLIHLKRLDLLDTQIKSIPNELLNLNLAYNDFFEIAQKLYRTKNFEHALLSYLKSLEIDSTKSNAFAYANVGLCYRMLGKPEKALAYLKKSLRFDENDTWCLNQLSYAYAAMNNSDKAIEYSEKSNRIKSDKVVWLETGNQLTKVNNYNQALKCYLKSLEIDSTYALAYGNVGMCYRMLGNPEKALTYLKKSLRFDEKNTWRLNQLSYTYAAMNNAAKAFEYAEKSNRIKIDKNVWLETGNQLSTVNNYEQALKSYLRFIEIDSTKTNDAAYSNAGLCYGKLSNPQRALECYNTAYSIAKKLTLIDSANYSNWFNLSFYCLFVNKYSEGILAAQKSLELDRKKETVITNLALNYVLNNQYNDFAKPLYEKWKDLKFPDDELNRSAKVLFLKDIQDLEDANITHPDFEKVRNLLKE